MGTFHNMDVRLDTWVLGILSRSRHLNPPKSAGRSDPLVELANRPWFALIVSTMQPRSSLKCLEDVSVVGDTRSAANRTFRTIVIVLCF